MHVEVHEDSRAVGRRGAELVIEQLHRALQHRGEAALLVATGASQMHVLEQLCAATFPWELVTVLHLDEYIGLTEDHPASFRRYLRERLIEKIPLKRFIPINAEGDISRALRLLEETVEGLEIDAGLVGIGENAHIAFNDPPADFVCADCFRVATLDLRCKEQQVREGWFASVEEVPSQAITMTVSQILRSRRIVSCVPFAVKAEAVRATLEHPVSEEVPSTALRSHPDVWLILDGPSASGTSTATLATYSAGAV